MKYFHDINLLDMGNYYTFEIIEDANEYVSPQILVTGGKYYSYEEAYRAATQAMFERGLNTRK